MKLLVGLILTLCAFQAHAQGSDTVAEFRAAIDYRFTRLQAFYDAMNNAMTLYRMAHVELVSQVYNDLMQLFGEDIEYVRRSRTYVNNVIADVLLALGGQPNPCLSSVMGRLIQNSAAYGLAFNACAQRVNRTMVYSLNGGFYPTFQEIQSQASTTPLATLSALSRGNVFEDNADILTYLQSQYDVKVMQWLGGVSQLFRWDTNRLRVEAGFYVEEMLDCVADPKESYSNTNTVLMFEAWDQCRPQ